MEEKVLVQISDPFGLKAFPIDKESLPEEAKKSIKEIDEYPGIKYCKSDNSIVDYSAVYFRVVKKFRKGIHEVETDDFIFGI